MAPFCSRFPFVSSFRFRFPFRRILNTIHISLSLLCFLHFNIHILDAFFNDLFGLSVNETVFSTSTWFFSSFVFFFVFFCCFFLFWQNFSQWNFFDLCLWDFLLFSFWHFSSFLSPLHPPLCLLLAVSFTSCGVLLFFWQIVSNEFSLETAAFLAWFGLLPLQLFPYCTPPLPLPLAGQFKREF